MLPIQINDAEWELFAGEPASYFKLYCFLKRHMDFSTGIAGVKTRINDVAIRNVFMVDPVPGRHASDPLKRGVWRSALRRINKIGALKTIAPNVFQFPPSVCITPFKTGRTKEEPCDAPQDAAATSAPRALRLVASNTFEGLKESQGAPEDEQMRDPLLISSSTSSCAQAAEPVERFWMHPAWIPAADTWHALLGSYGVDPAECTPDRLGEWREYWVAEIGKPKREPMSQGQWEHALAGSLRRNVNRAAEAAQEDREPKKARKHSATAQKKPKRTGSGRGDCPAALEAQELTLRAAVALQKVAGVSANPGHGYEQFLSMCKPGKGKKHD